MKLISLFLIKENGLYLLYEVIKKDHTRMSVGLNRPGWPASTRNPLKLHGFILLSAVCSLRHHELHSPKGGDAALVSSAYTMWTGKKIVSMRNQFLQDMFWCQLHWIIEPFLSPLASFSGWVTIFVSWRSLTNNGKLGSLKMTETEGSGGSESRGKMVAGTPKALEEAPSFASYSFWWLWRLLTIGPIVLSSVL